MDNLMTIDMLTKKLTNDVVFAAETRNTLVNVTYISADTNKTYQYLVYKDENTIRPFDCPDYKMNLEFNNLGYSNVISGSFSFKSKDGMKYIMQTKDNKTEIAHIISASSAILLQFFKKSEIGVIYPITYLVHGYGDLSHDSDCINIISDFMEGCCKYHYRQIFLDIWFKVETDIHLTGIDGQINEGFNIKRTAETFAMDDLVDNSNDHIQYTWDPITCLLSVNTPISDEPMSIRLYYTKTPDKLIEDNLEGGKLVFSYFHHMKQAAVCMIDKNREKDFYSDDNVRVEYKYNDLGIIEYFKYYMDGKLIVSSKRTNVELNFNMMEIVSSVIDNDIIWTSNSYMEYGSYFSKDCSFTYNQYIRNIPHLKSFVYTYDNLYVKSIAYNNIKII